MRIIKPMKLGFLKKTWSNRSKHHLAVAAVCFFNLRHPQGLLMEAPQWSKMIKSLEPCIPMDLVIPKRRGEVLVSGKAYAPGGSPISEMAAGIDMGPIHKRLQVFGNRFRKRGWLPLHKITSPQKFKEMPIFYLNSFGGQKFNRNPKGKGYQSFLQWLFCKGDINISLPNIETPLEAGKSTRQRLEPAGLGPLPPHWPQRLKYFGTHDKRLEKNVPLEFPRNINWEFFNTAPSDQRIDGFFRGDEPYTLIGMHPELQKLSGRLPGVQPRIFVKFKASPANQLEELNTNLDTVWFFPDKEIGALFYRGSIEIQDSDGLDVDSIMLAYENIKDAPRSMEYYRDAFTKRTNKKTSTAHAFNESQLSPLKTSAQLKLEADQKKRAADRELEFQRKAARLSAEKYYAKLGMNLPDDLEIPDPEPSRIGPIPPEAFERLDFDLSETLEKVNELAEQSRQEAEEKIKDARRKQESLLADLKAKDLLPDEKRNIEQQKREVTEKALKPVAKYSSHPEENTASGEPTHGSKLDQFLSGLGIPIDRDELGKVPDLDENKITEAEGASRQARQLAPHATHPREPLFPETAKYLGDLFMDLARKGEILAGRDFAGADLSGKDLQGMDLREIMLEQAILTDTCFDNCNMEGSVLAGAILDGTSFKNTNLHKANLAETRGKNTIFNNADMRNAILMKAELPGSEFIQTRLKKANATEGRFEYSNWNNAEIQNSIFVKANLNNSECTKTSIDASTFINAKLNRINFSGAKISRTMLIHVDGENTDFREVTFNNIFAGGGSSFAGADFSHATGIGTGWRKADFKGANFFSAQFNQSDFGEANLSNAVLGHAAFKNSIFIGSDLSRSNCQKTNFYRAILNKARFRESDLTSANLYAALMKETDFENADTSNVLLLKGPKG